MEASFSLLDEPWIRVSKQDGTIDTVSLKTLFQHAHEYRQLAGEMPAQDLAILRLLLAILLTVYSRYDANGEMYDWVDLNDKMEPLVDDIEYLNDLYEENDDILIGTWATLYIKQRFSDVVIQYLEKHRDRFDLLSPEHPFYQVPVDVYNANVDVKKRITPGSTSGEVVLKLLNRTVSESANSPAIFASKSGLAKNELTLPELARWIITYQSFCGTSDKSKADPKGKHNYLIGWPFTIHPIYIKGDSLFDTLMLNLTLTTANHTSLLERPVWEQDEADYVAKRLTDAMPDNTAELYTLWSRMLYLRHDADGWHLFSAKLPAPDVSDSKLEPMTTWRYSSKNKTYFAPHLTNNDRQQGMWPNFGAYVPTKDTEYAPGVVTWARTLQQARILPRHKMLNLVVTGFIDDGNASSKMPADEVYDQLSLPSDIAFDAATAKTWPDRINDAVQATNTALWFYSNLVHVLGGFWGFTKQHGLSGFAEQRMTQIYTAMDRPFNEWLSSLTADDDRDQKVREWYQMARQILYQACQDALTTMSAEQLHQALKPNDFLTSKNQAKGFGSEPKSIFEVVSYYWHGMRRVLPIKPIQKEDVQTNDEN